MQSLISLDGLGRIMHACTHAHLRNGCINRSEASGRIEGCIWKQQSRKSSTTGLHPVGRSGPLLLWTMAQIAVNESLISGQGCFAVIISMTVHPRDHISERYIRSKIHHFYPSDGASKGPNIREIHDSVYMGRCHTLTAIFTWLFF